MEIGKMKILLTTLIFGLFINTATANDEECSNCHQQIIDQPLVSHVDNTHQQFGLSCLDCHNATPSDPGVEHYSFQLRLLPDSASCQECHAK